MLRGGVARRGQRGLLLGALLATSACGVLVGFEAREFCDDCSDSAGGTGGTQSGPTGVTETSGGGSETSGAGAGGAVTSASSGGTSAGGSGGSDTIGVGGTATGGAGGAGGTGGAEAGGAGGTGGAGGATSGSTETVSGTGGTDTSGTGGSTENTTTTTSSLGGSTSEGGSGGFGGSGGSGGTGGAPSLCSVGPPFNASETIGIHPADLMLGSSTVRPWDLTWVESNDVYFAAYHEDGDSAVSSTPIDTSGTHSASVLVTQDQYAFVAYGEVAAGDARIVMNQVTVQDPLEPEDVVQGTTEPLEDDTAPDVMGVALRGVSTKALVAAMGVNKDGILALFNGDEYMTAGSVAGPLAAITPLDLGDSFAVAFIQDGVLQVALVPDDLDPVEEALTIPAAAPTTTSERSLAAASLDDGAALVWVESDGIYLTTLDGSGAAASRVQVSVGDNHILPRVATLGSQIAVSWIDADTDTLHFRRFPTGLTGTSEPPLLVMEQVAETRYGFAADSFSVRPATFGFVVATDRLQVVFVACPAVEP